MTPAREPTKPPRFHDLPAGTRVRVDLPREAWPTDRQADGRTVRMELHGELARAPFQDYQGQWWAQLRGRTTRWPLERVKPQRGAVPQRAPKKQPTIPVEVLEQKAREVIGDSLVRVECIARYGRSERIRMCLDPIPEDKRDQLRGRFKGKDYGSHITISKMRPGGDPDASRKSFLKFLDDCTATANAVAGRLRGSVIES